MSKASSSSAAASGIVLLVATAIALTLANSPLAEFYARAWHTPIGLAHGPLAFQRSTEWLVNDGLMAIFFFSVGLEIRRETREGVLSEWRRAVVPVAAALGGMLVPAAFYLALAGGPPTRSGWGTPMATDIAFALGILALLGKRVPDPLRVLLLALAVADDLGAIVVIAIFYSKGIAVAGLGVAAAAFASIAILQRIGVRSKLVYAIPAIVAWAGVYASGIHPTIAGVIVGIMTPARKLEGPAVPSPARAVGDALQPWIAFGIMPIFALANAGLSFSGTTFDASATRVATGVALGLILGKPIGVLAATWIAVKLRLGVLPAGIRARHVLVLGCVAGIGFTMAIFIAQLAFAGDVHLLGAAKLGVLGASAGAACLALGLGRLLLRAPEKADVSAT